MDTDGNVKLGYNHASKYVLTTAIPKGTYVKDNPNIGAGGLLSIVPYFMEEGKQVIVKMSGIVDGKLAFFAPETVFMNTRIMPGRLVILQNTGQLTILPLWHPRVNDWGRR